MRATGTRINGYTLALMAGVVVSSHLFLVLASRMGISLGAGIGGFALVLAAAIVGARLMFVVEHWDRFARRPSDAWKHGDPGAASFGGILGALVAAVPLSLALGQPLGAVLDLVVLAGLPGLAVGRVGCLHHGCCPGRGTRVPLQWLQISAALGVWALALGFATWSGVDGLAFLVAAVAYSLLRVLTDSWRDLPRGRHGLAASQIVALGLCGLGILGILGLFVSYLHGVSS